MLIRLLQDIFQATIHCIDYVRSGVNSILTCYIVFGYNISYCNTVKLNELFVFVLLSFFITLMNLSVQIRGAQTRHTVVSFDLNQPLTNHRKKNITGWQFLAVDLSATFLNTGITNETFQQCGKQDLFRNIEKFS